MDDPRSQAVRKFGRETPPPTDWLGVMERYATDPPLAVRTLIDALRPAATPGARFCELGFGPGWLLTEMAREFVDASLYGLDLSKGVVRGARDAFGSRVAASVGDMEHLPFRDGAFDAIATCWTLYFMRDIDAALAEIKRCLAPEGVVVAATTAPDHMREYDEIAAQALRSIGREPEPDIAWRFDTQSGEAYMRRHFPNAELREWHGELTVDDPAPLLVLWPGYGPQSLTSEENIAARTEFARLAGEQIKSDGTLRITRHDGAFVATK